jgi:hypothetical protein
MKWQKERRAAVQKISIKWVNWSQRQEEEAIELMMMMNRVLAYYKSKHLLWRRENIRPHMIIYERQNQQSTSA